MKLSLSDAAVSLIAEKGCDPVYGARPLKRLIQQVIENPLSMEILKGSVGEGARLSAEVEGHRIVFKTIYLKNYCNRLELIVLSSVINSGTRALMNNFCASCANKLGWDTFTIFK